MQSALAVLFGKGGGADAAAAAGNGGKTAYDSLSPNNSSAAGPPSVLNVPKGMSVPEFVRCFTNPDDVLSRDREYALGNVANLAAAASAAIVSSASSSSSASYLADSSSSASSSTSLSAFLLAQARRDGERSAFLASASAAAAKKGIAGRHYKTHQRWFEVSLVTFPADVPSIAGAGTPGADSWLRPTNSTDKSRSGGSGGTNTVKVSVAEAVAPQYTSARVEVSRRYLMGLVGDLEQLAQRAV